MTAGTAPRGLTSRARKDAQTTVSTAPLHPRSGAVRAENSVGVALAIPATVLLAAFVLYPLTRALQYSFENWDGVGKATWAGFSNYADIWTQSIERLSIEHVGILLVFYSFIPTFLGMIAATLVARLPRRSGIFRVILFIPQVLVTVVIAIVWTWLLGPSGGQTINGLVHLVGLGPATGPAWLGNFSTALLSLGLIAVWLDFGLCFVLFLSGVQRIPPDLYDTARVDGAGLIREFTYVTVPMLRRRLGVAAYHHNRGLAPEFYPRLYSHRRWPRCFHNGSGYPRISRRLPAWATGHRQCSGGRACRAHVHIYFRCKSPAWTRPEDGPIARSPASA